MSFWGINASKKRNEYIPGSTKWIANELSIVNSLVLADSEQFAISITTELQWIDQHMKDVLDSSLQNNDSPKALLLRSPRKVPERSSPVKHSPMSRLSPVKLSQTSFFPSAKRSEDQSGSKARKLSDPPSKKESSENHDDSFQAISKEIRKSMARKSMARGNNTEYQIDTHILESGLESLPEGPLKSGDKGKLNVSSVAQIVSSIEKLNSIPLKETTKEQPSTTPHFRGSSGIGFVSLPARDPIIVKSNANRKSQKESLRETLHRISMLESSPKPNSSNGVNYKTLDKSNVFSIDEHQIKEQDDISPGNTLYPDESKQLGKIHEKYNDNDFSHDTETLHDGAGGRKSNPTVAMLSPIKHGNKPDNSANNHQSAVVLKESFSNVPQLKKSDSYEGTDNNTNPTTFGRSRTGSPVASIFSGVGSTLRRVFSPSKSNSPDRQQKSDIREIKSSSSFNSSTTRTIRRGNSPQKQQTNDLVSRLTAPTESSIAKSIRRAAAPTTTSSVDSKSVSAISTSTMNYSESPLARRHESSNKLVSLNLNPVKPPRFSPIKTPYGGLRQKLEKRSPVKKPTDSSAISTASTIEMAKENQSSSGSSTTTNTTNSQLNPQTQYQPSQRIVPIKRKSLLAELRQNQQTKQKQKVRVPMTSKRELERKTLASATNGAIIDNSISEQERDILIKSAYRVSPALVNGASKDMGPSANHSRGISVKRKSDESDLHEFKPVRSFLKSSTDPKRRKTGDEGDVDEPPQQQRQHQTQQSRSTVQKLLEKKAGRISASGRNIAATSTNGAGGDLVKNAIIHNAHKASTSKFPYGATSLGVKSSTEKLKFADKKNNIFQSNPITNSSDQSNRGRSRTPITPKSSATNSKSVLPEIFSESDDDEEGSVLKDWANSPELRTILYHQKVVDPDQIFGPIAPLQMDDIFDSRLSRYRGRGSSAQWTGQDMLTAQEVDDYANEMGYKRE